MKHRPTVVKDRGRWHVYCHNCTVNHNLETWMMALYHAHIHWYTHQKDKDY